MANLIDRIKGMCASKKVDEQEYEPLTDDASILEYSAYLVGGEETPFSWLEYSIFALIGVAMLWAWYECPPAP